MPSQFWAAEGLTLFGGFSWWARNDEYTPAFCRVDGRQVDHVAAAHAARDLGFAARSIDASSGAIADALGSRLVGGLLLGASGGILAGSAKRLSGDIPTAESPISLGLQRPRCSGRVRPAPVNLARMGGRSAS